MRNPFQQTVEDAGKNYAGSLLTFTDGKYFLDKAEVEIGRAGLLLTVIMTRACHSGVMWVNNKPTGLDLQYYNDVAPPREIRARRQAVHPIALPRRRRSAPRTAGHVLEQRLGRSDDVRRPGCPIPRVEDAAVSCLHVGLEAARRHLGNSDPTFTPIAWKPRSDFPDLAGEDPDWAALPEPPKQLPRNDTSLLIDDEVPF